MGVEAARLALRGRDRVARRTLLVLDRDPGVPRQDQRHRDPRRAAARRRRRAVRPRRRRSARRVGALLLALDGGGRPRWSSPADIRTGLPGSADEAAGGDARRRVRGRRRRRRPGDRRASSASAQRHRGVPRPLAHPGRRAAPRSWEERFGEISYVPLGEQAWNAALEGGRARPPTRSTASSSPAPHGRAGARGRPASSAACDGSIDDLAADRRQHRRRAARPAARRRARAGRARPGASRWSSLADGADVLLFRTTDAIAALPAGAPGRRRRSPPARRSPYGKFLAWRGHAAGRAAPPARAAARRRPPPPAAARTGSSASSARRSATPARVHLPPARVSTRRRRTSTTWSRRRWPTCRARSSRSPSTARVLAEPADRVRGRRLRRRRPAARSSSPTSTPTRSQIGDRVEMTFRRLFTADGIHNYFWKARPVRVGEGTTMGSHGIKDRVAIVGMGCTRFGEHWDKGLDDLAHRRRQRGVRVGRRRQGRRRRLLARHRAGRHERHHARPAAAARGQAGHPGRELLRHRLRGAAPGRLRGGVGRVRRGDGGRRREGQGQRLPGPQRVPDPERRHRAARSPRPRCSRWSRPRTPRSTASTRRAARGAGPHRVEEPLQRRPQPAGAVPPGDDDRARSAPCPTVAGELGVFDCAGVADGVGRRDRRAGRGRAQATPTSRST